MKCEQCGASLTPEELARESCAYCGAVLPYLVRAAEKAALVGQLLADRNHNGVPDILEGLGAGAAGRSPGHAVAEVSVSTEVMVNGKLVTDPSALPPEARRMLESLHGMAGRFNTSAPPTASSMMGSIEKTVADSQGRFAIDSRVLSADEIRVSTLVPVPARRTSGFVWAIIGALATLVVVLAVLLALR